MKKTAILYARASTQEQSTKIQIQQLEKYCIENDIEVLKTFAENVSGAAEHRDELEKILNSDPLADLLIIREASRLSREEDYNEAYFKLQLLLKKYSIYILADNIYLERGKTDLAKDIMMMIKLFGAADERKNIKLRTTTAVKKYKENPINVVSGNGNFGMMKAPNPNFSKGVNTRNIWVKNPDEWKTVLKVFELRSKGYSINKISQYLGLKVCIVRQIFESKVINYYMEQDHKELLFAAEDKKVELTTVKAPSKHLNKYKGKIFVENSDYYMRHQIAAKGIYFKDKLGKMTIKESIIDDCVIRTIKCMLAFFDLKKTELSKNNEINII